GGRRFHYTHGLPSFSEHGRTGTIKRACPFRQNELYGRIILISDQKRMPAKLSVNMNAVALLRTRRDLPWPSVTGLGRIALAAGAHGLTVHPRPDQRHTRFSDLPE